MKGEEHIIPVIMRLRGAAPEAWEDFVQKMRFLSAIRATELVRASGDTIFQMQGQARAFEEIVSMLVEAPQKHQKAEELRNARTADQGLPPFARTRSR